MRCFNDECHFETEGKWGVTKWFRIPYGLRSSLSSGVAARYGWDQKPEERIIEQLDQTRLPKDWNEVTSLSQKLQDVAREGKVSNQSFEARDQPQFVKFCEIRKWVIGEHFT